MSASMTWEQKFEAIQALGGACLRMRSPGNWYVSQPGVDVRSGPMLEGRYGNGGSPEAAVLDHWHRLTTLDFRKDEVVVLDAMRETRRHVRWNGYRWAEEPIAQPGGAA